MLVEQVELVGDQLEAGHQPRPHRRQATGQPAGRARSFDVAHVDAEVLEVHLRQPLEPAAQQLDLGRARPLLRSEHLCRVDEAGLDVAPHEKLDALEPVDGIQRPHRTETAVGGGRSADPEHDPPDAGIDRGRDQLSRPVGRRRHRIVALGAADQLEARGSGHLDDGAAAARGARRLRSGRRADRSPGSCGSARPARRASPRHRRRAAPRRRPSPGHARPGRRPRPPRRPRPFRGTCPVRRRLCARSCSQGAAPAPHRRAARWRSHARPLARSARSCVPNGGV